MKKYLALLCVVALIVPAGMAIADHGKSSSRKSQCSYSQKKGLDSIFFYKAHKILKQRDALGLSDEQVGAIKTLKRNVKKELIRQQAEIDTLCAVIARDRARIESEGAAYARSKAESETHGRTDESV